MGNCLMDMVFQGTKSLGDLLYNDVNILNITDLYT